MEQAPLCAICSRALEIDNTVLIKTVKRRGIDTFIKRSRLANDNKWKDWLDKDELQCHEYCRALYSQRGVIPEPSATSVSEIPSDLERDAIPEFEFQTKCFICGLKFNKGCKGTSFITQDDARDRIIEIAQQRNDPLGDSVVGRMQCVFSLTRCKARSHNKCYSKFSKLPQVKNVEDLNSSRIDSLLTPVWELLEKDKSVKHTLSTLMEIIGDHAPHRKTVCAAIRRKYGEEVECCTIGGRDISVFFKSYHEFNVSANTNTFTGDQKKIVLQAASEILRNEIIDQKFNSEEYPPSNNFLQNVSSESPPMLSHFLKTLLGIDEKIEKQSKKKSKET